MKSNEVPGSGPFLATPNASDATATLRLELTRDEFHLLVLFVGEGGLALDDTRGSWTPEMVLAEATLQEKLLPGVLRWTSADDEDRAEAQQVFDQAFGETLRAAKTPV